MWLASAWDISASTIRWLASGALVIDPPNPKDQPAASEQATHDMRSSVPMTSLWRVRYSLNGNEGYSAWTPIGETVQVPAGAVYLGYETGGEPIVGGPWLAQGGGVPKI